jgi:hypothetical protein
MPADENMDDDFEREMDQLDAIAIQFRDRGTPE